MLRIHHTYTTSLTTISSAQAIILFIFSTQSIRFSAFNCSVTPCILLFQKERTFPKKGCFSPKKRTLLPKMTCSVPENLISYKIALAFFIPEKNRKLHFPKTKSSFPKRELFFPKTRIFPVFTFGNFQACFCKAFIYAVSDGFQFSQKSLLEKTLCSFTHSIIHFFALSIIQ